MPAGGGWGGGGGGWRQLIQILRQKTKTKRKMYTTKSKNKDRTELAWRPNKTWIGSCYFIAFHFKNYIVVRYLNTYT